MNKTTKIKSGEIPLELARSISEQVRGAFESGELLNMVSPVTKELIKFWFMEPFTTGRAVNFHRGQREAILNIIYLCEVAKVENVADIYQKCGPKLLSQRDLDALAKGKNDHRKFAIKLATGTGKTWVMNAILIYQYLNAINTGNANGVRYSKNFLILAPGIIVYERLLDSCQGRKRSDGTRDVETSDILRNRELFLPREYEESLRSFLSSSVMDKNEIGRKLTGGGMIAISNNHLFYIKSEDKESVRVDPMEDPSATIKNLVPLAIGKSDGNSLDALDRGYMRSGAIEYLADLEDLVVMNDEAHHIHDKNGKEDDVKWQESLDYISRGKKHDFMQIDFSATPYEATKKGGQIVKNYFLHTIVDFDLKAAIKEALVKTIVIDRRKEINTIELDYRAKRDEADKKVLGLSNGQKVMISAGLTKLKILENDFAKLNNPKYPKMLIMCEEIAVLGYVEEYLKEIGLKDSEFATISSDKSGNISAKDMSILKDRIFSMDDDRELKVVASVLVLKEGFDVSNVCVIVPLRSNSSSILLEQTIGRGLRLMFRGEEYIEAKAENRLAILRDKKAPKSYLDVLSIIEHPAFIDFYDDLVEDGEVGYIEDEMIEGKSIGDIVKVELKEDYKDYEIEFINIKKEASEELVPLQIDICSIPPYTSHNLETLKSFVGHNRGERFNSQELISKTIFGDYSVKVDIYSASSYNDYLMRLLAILNRQNDKFKNKALPLIQIDNHEILRAIDEYIRFVMFGGEFNPLVDENWRVLVMDNQNTVNHIVSAFVHILYNMQNDIKTTEPEVERIGFSVVPSFNAQEKYCLPLHKTIYTKTKYPSNKGGLEKAFLEFLDNDAKVLKFIKVLENVHTFASIMYFRDDGLASRYYPDFLVETAIHIYVVETKATDNLKNKNVLLKRKSAEDFVRRINDLDSRYRNGKIWEYLLLGDNRFYSLKHSGADIDDIAISTKLSASSGNILL